MSEEKDLQQNEDIADAKAKAAAAAKAKAASQAGGVVPEETGDEKAKAIAVAKAKAAAVAAAKKAATEGAAPEVAKVEEQTPSPNQSKLDNFIKIIKEMLGNDSLEDTYINKLSKDAPTLVVKPEFYFKVAEVLKTHTELRFDYAAELHGTDFKTYMEIYVHLFSFGHKHNVVLRTKIDRENPRIESLVPLWKGTNWPECEAYDLLGIKFEGHPELHRIFLGEDWIGFPLRKDYVPFDVEEV